MKQAVLKVMMPMMLLLCAAALMAQDVKYNYDREVNFASYRTYQWDEPRGGAGDPLGDHDIRRAIENQLAEKGMGPALVGDGAGNHFHR